MFERPGRIGDHFPPPFANDQAARAANGGAVPPDMSVLAKARGVERGFPQFIFDMFTQYQEGGPDYIHAILNGYEDAPKGFKMPPGAQYNKYFPGHAIGMPKPLSDGQVEYTDGTPATVDQYGRDISAFLMWAAEPHARTEEAHRPAGHAVPDRVRGPDVFHQEAGLARHRAASEQLQPRPPTEILLRSLERKAPHHEEAAVAGEPGDDGGRQHEQKSDDDGRRDGGERRLDEEQHQAKERDAQVDDDDALAGLGHDRFSGCVGRHGSPECGRPQALTAAAMT